MAKLKTSEYRLQERCPATESRRKSITASSVKYLPFFAFVIDGPSTTFSKAQGTSKHAGASRHFGSGAIVAVIALGAEWRRKERERAIPPFLCGTVAVLQGKLNEGDGLDEAHASGASVVPRGHGATLGPHPRSH